MRFILPSTWPGSLLSESRLLDDVVPSFFGPAPAILPALNIWSDEDTVRIQAELPGLRQDDLELSVLGDELTLAGERRSDRDESARLLHGERRFGKFRRVVRLPFPVDADSVSASLENGVLTVTLPRAASDRPRRIPLQATQD